MLFNIAKIMLASDTTLSDGGAADAIGQIGQVAKDSILNIIRTLVPIIFAIVASVGVIYGIILGVNYAKAEDTSKREEAKKRLINAIIGFGIAIVVSAIMWIIAGSDLLTNLFN